MADPICRWRNTTVKQVCEFTQILPHETLPKNEARELIEKKWNQWDGGNNFFRTPYQLAAQLGLYYEDATTYYPRFDHPVTIDEAEYYIREWLKRYYVPNPYTTSISYNDSPIVLNTALLNEANAKHSGVDLIKFFRDRMNIEVGNVDILTNLLIRFSDFKQIENLLYSTRQTEPIVLEYSNESSSDKKAFFDTFSDIKIRDKNVPYEKEEATESLQQIFYGAPGTGKSHCVKRETDSWEKIGRVVRTTFHPDSEYSTFVGAYKPTTESVQRYDIYNKPMTRDGESVMEQVITYNFVAQAFLKSYVDAWKNREQPEFLIIEEINRGNCAQILGDLFQLLDRGDDGYSEYPIKADQDLQKYLNKALADAEIADYPKVKSGEELMLPDNLYIRATMNTSDQSLFPIDSAFKRRWDWRYIPIAKGSDNGVELNWTVDVAGSKYDWWTFVETINKHVFGQTNSEDKQLGFFFCKAKNNTITVDIFVSKVIFYLWNDVFKDFGFNDAIFIDHDDTVNSKLSFDKFFLPNGKVNVETVRKFFANLGIEPLSDEVNDDYEVDNTGKRIFDRSKYSVNGQGEYGKSETIRVVMQKYVDSHPGYSVEDVISEWRSLFPNLIPHIVESQAEYDARLQATKQQSNNTRAKKVEWNGKVIYTSTQVSIGNFPDFIKIINSTDWNIHIEQK